MKDSTIKAMVNLSKEFKELQTGKEAGLVAINYDILSGYPYVHLEVEKMPEVIDEADIIIEDFNETYYRVKGHKLDVEFFALGKEEEVKELYPVAFKKFKEEK